MKIGIMQPYFLPYIGYWQLLNAVDKYVIYDDVNFIKGGWINRNRMLMNNEAKLFNIQMDGASPNKKINEIKLSSNKVWRKKLIKSIELNYAKAPMFDEIFPLIRSIIDNEEENLAKFIKNSLVEVSKYLKIETEIIISSDLNKDNDLKAEEKVIEICKLLKGNEYYNAVGGQELYSFEEFRKNDIELKFLKTEEIEYRQFNDSFISNLSILDVLMFNEKEEIQQVLKKYEVLEEAK
ncbi:MAG: WbqC family protein [Clostridium sp.]